VPSLVAWHGTRKVGTLSWVPPLWRFAYDDDWAAQATSFPLSPHFPLASREFEGDSVKWFFQNLLPEGNLLHAIAAREGVRPDNAFALLSRLGRECAGALSLVPEGEPPPKAEGRYRELDGTELLRHVREMESTPLLTAAADARMSLAGAQDKLPIRYLHGRIWVPLDYSPTTHILKPENVRRDLYPGTVLNEWFCMRLARLAGLPTPPCERIRVGGEPFYLVQRFDREEDVQGNVQRIHQNDLCQALDKWPDYKYEELGGATLPEYFAAIDRYAASPAPARVALTRWVVFNFLIGNSDAHAKNISFLFRGRSLQLAPFYDLLCVKIYGDTRLAASIGDHNQYGWIERGDWLQFAERARLNPKLVLTALADLAMRLPQLARDVATGTQLDDTEGHSLLERIIAVIDEHARFAQDAVTNE
jgi:serine/threonine-protein kinase HipA